MLQDLRYAVRTLLRKPGFTVAAVAVLALGIGANTAIFSVVHAVMLNPLPYPDAERIQLVYMTNVQQERLEEPISVADFKDLADQSRAFEKVAAYQNGATLILRTERGAEFLNGTIVSAEFFSVLGAPPLIGRTFQTGEDKPEAPLQIVISERLWRNMFNADPGIAGRVVNFTAGPMTVIGVMPAAFQFPRNTVDFWRNFRLAPPTSRRPPIMWAMGRVRADVAPEALRADLAAVARRLAEAYPLTNSGVGFRPVPLADYFFGDVRAPLYILFSAVVFVLLIASANIANLLLARSTSREKEIAIRAALGAARSRIARQLLTESIVLAFAGGIAGLAVAAWALDVFISFAPATIPRLEQVTLNATVLAFAALASLVTGVFFGLAPALRARTIDLNSRLKDAGRGNTATGTQGLRRALVVTEIALSLILLTGAGLAVRSFARLRNVDTGFDASSVVAIRMALSSAAYATPDRILAFYDEVMNRISGLAGVETVGTTNSLPPIQNDVSESFTIEGRALAAGENPPIATLLYVSPGYFDALRIPVIRGRAFNGGDRSGAPRVAMISEALARRFFAGEDPVGKRLKMGGAERPDAAWMEIVGVVKDVKYDGLSISTEPAYYVPFMQLPGRGQDVVIRTTGNPLSLVPALRAQVNTIDPAVAIVRVTTLEDRISQAIGQSRFQTSLLLVFSVLALVLAGVGIYGVLSYSISLRVHEIGVRISLGASRVDVLRMVLAEGMALAAAGIASGFIGSLVLTRLMATMLFEVSPHDPLTYTIVSITMTAVVLLACLIPAERATRVDPIVALRCE
jgi:putative ABC transport system permease protein